VAGGRRPRSTEGQDAKTPRLTRARTFLTLVVLLHHGRHPPYTYYGHTDPKEFFGFDMIVLATDSFFMAMFFFSVRAVSSGQASPGRGPLNHLADRLRRLALPFVICAFTVIPLAYYAISLRQTSCNRLFRNSGGPRSPRARGRADRSGFLWVLFVFDPGCLPAVSAVTLTCSIRSIASHCNGRPSARRVLRGHACCHRRVLHSRAGFTSEPAAGSSSGRSRSSTGRVLLYASYFFLRWPA